MRPLASPVASVSCVWCTSEDKHHLQWQHTGGSSSTAWVEERRRTRGMHLSAEDSVEALPCRQQLCVQDRCGLEKQWRVREQSVSGRWMTMASCPRRGSTGQPSTGSHLALFCRDVEWRGHDQICLLEHKYSGCDVGGRQGQRWESSRKLEP